LKAYEICAFLVVLEGDFNNEDDDSSTPEEFEGNAVKQREGKRPLLTGDLQVTLKDGVGTRIREAKTESLHCEAIWMFLLE